MTSRSFKLRETRCDSVLLGCASMELQELRRGAARLGLDGRIGPGADEPLSHLQVAPRASLVQGRLPVGRAVGGVERCAHAVQPLSDREVAVEAGLVEGRPSRAHDGVERGAHAVQPLGDIEVTLQAGYSK